MVKINIFSQIKILFTFVANMANRTNIIEREIRTEVFRTGCAPHARAVAESGVGRWWWAIFLPLALTAIYGFSVDIRWLILSVAILLLLVPALTLFGYIGAISDPDAVEALYPRRAIFRADGSLLVTTLPLPRDSVDLPQPGTDTYVAEDTAAPKQSVIRREEIASASYRGKFLEVRFGAAGRRMLIPLEAFESPSDPTILAEAFGKPAVNS